MSTMRSATAAAILAALLLGTVPAGAVERLAESTSFAPLDIAATAMPVAASAQFQPGLAALPELPAAAAQAPQEEILSDNPLLPAKAVKKAGAAAAPSALPSRMTAAPAGDASGLTGYAAGVRSFDNGILNAAADDRSAPVVVKKGRSARAGKGRENDDSLPHHLATIHGAKVVFPGTRTVVEISADSDEGRSLLAASKGADHGYVLKTTDGDPSDGLPFHTGIAAKVIGAVVENGMVKATLQMHREAQINDIDRKTWRAEVMYRNLPFGDEASLSRLLKEAKEILLGMNADPLSLEHVFTQGQRAIANQLAGIAIQLGDLTLEEQQELLAANTVEERTALAVSYLRGVDPEAAEAAAEKADSAEDGSAELLEKIEKAGMPDYAKDKALKELARMKRDKSERENIRKWLELMVELPWSRRKPETVDLKKAKAILDADHSGLADVKKAVLKSLAVRAQTGDTGGGVMGFEGPPGVGKTTIAKAWAAATGRDLVVISLGGKSDEKYLRGFDRTYHTSDAGVLMKELRDISRNSVIVLDEADQAGQDSRNGNLMAALLELLDPVQNKKFKDTYLGVPFDLSDIMFIVTGNDFSKFPLAVRDRMKLVTFGSYTLNEKVEIARKYAVRRMLEKNGLKDIEFTDEALRAVIKGYTREAGVRGLHNQLDDLFAELVYLHQIEGQPIPSKIDAAGVAKLLGAPKYTDDAVAHNGVGQATGLGVSGLGGSTLSVQAKLIPGGSGRLVLRDEMGKSYRDSAENAWAYVRSRAAEFGFDLEQLKTHDLHVSMAPSGEIDGPSAGLAMATAMVSAITGRPVRDGVAMTGAIDLYGKAWAIGGLRDKVIAAEREGYTKVLYPISNQVHVPGIPADVATHLELRGVKDFDEVLEQALGPKPDGARDGYRDLGDGSMVKQDGYGFHSVISVVRKDAKDPE